MILYPGAFVSNDAQDVRYLLEMLHIRGVLFYIFGGNVNFGGMSMLEIGELSSFFFVVGGFHGNSVCPTSI